MQHKTNSISKFVNFLFIIAVFSVLTTSINAQYGNLLSKKAADALAAGDPTVCDEEMLVLINKDVNNYAANVERVRCYFLIYSNKKHRDAIVQDFLKSGKTEADARKEADEFVQKNVVIMRTLIGITTSANPKYAPAFNLSGMIYRLEGNNAEAEKAFARAIELEPSNFRPYANRAKMRDDLGNTAGAIADYEKVVALGINDSFIAKRLPELKGTAAKSDKIIINGIEITREDYEAGVKAMKDNPELKKKALETLNQQSISLAYLNLRTSQRFINNDKEALRNGIDGEKSRKIELLRNLIKTVESGIKQVQEIRKNDKVTYSPKDLENFRLVEEDWQKDLGQAKGLLKSLQDQ
jgi:tetratricopeptide (TPR) repeat protein